MQNKFTFNVPDSLKYDKPIGTNTKKNADFANLYNFKHSLSSNSNSLKETITNKKDSENNLLLFNRIDKNKLTNIQPQSINTNFSQINSKALGNLSQRLKVKDELYQKPSLLNFFSTNNANYNKSTFSSNTKPLSFSNENQRLRNFTDSNFEHKINSDYNLTTYSSSQGLNNALKIKRLTKSSEVTTMPNRSLKKRRFLDDAYAETSGFAAKKKSMVSEDQSAVQKIKKREKLLRLGNVKVERAKSITLSSPNRPSFHEMAIQQKPVSNDIKKEEIEEELRLMIGTECTSNVEKYQLLKRRDELLCKLKVRNTDVTIAEIIHGNCPDMCPEKERYMRDTQKNLNRYECDSNGVMLAEKTVKDYSRSAADQEEPLRHELRPPVVLELTMNYLITQIANNVPSSQVDLAKWYDFLWSRTRSIRKDITQQMLSDKTAANLVEQCARIHIFAAYRLAHLNESEFSQKMNTENLSKALQTLRHMYDDMAQEKVFCKNEAEFRSYDMLLNLSDSNVHSQVLSYRHEIYISAPVQLALELATAFQSNNYVHFFRTLRLRSSYLQACICHRYFSAMRFSALKAIQTAYRMIPLDVFVNVLAFNDDSDALSFLSVFNLEAGFDLNITLIDNRLKILLSEMPEESIPNGNCNWINEKAENLSIPEILCNEKCQYIEMPPPTNSFDEFHRYNCDPVNPFTYQMIRTNNKTCDKTQSKNLDLKVIKEEPISDCKENLSLSKFYEPNKKTEVALNFQFSNQSNNKSFLQQSFKQENFELKNFSKKEPSLILPTFSLFKPKENINALDDEKQNKVNNFGFKFQPLNNKVTTPIQSIKQNENIKLIESHDTKLVEEAQKSKMEEIKHLQLIEAKKREDERLRKMEAEKIRKELESKLLKAAELKNLEQKKEIEKIKKQKQLVIDNAHNQEMKKIKYWEKMIKLKENADAFVISSTTTLFFEIINNEVEIIANTILNKEKKIFDGLSRISSNLYKLWIKQFINHWRLIAIKKRQLREFPLPIESTKKINITLPYNSFLRRSIDENKIKLCFFQREKKKNNEKKLATHYFNKWRQFVDYNKKKRFIDEFFVEKTLINCTNDVYSLHLKRKAESISAFHLQAATPKLKNLNQNKHQLLDTPILSRKSLNLKNFNPSHDSSYNNFYTPKSTSLT